MYPHYSDDNKGAYTGFRFFHEQNSKDIRHT